MRALLADDPREPVLASARLILSVLEHRSERHIHDLRCETIRTEECERGGPVDGLRDARRLLQV